MAITVVSTTAPPATNDVVTKDLSESTETDEQTDQVESTDETETETETDETELATAGEEETDQAVVPQVKPKKMGGFQKKLVKAQGEISAKDQKIADLEKQLATKGTTQTESKETVQVDDPLKEPDIDKFDSVGAYTKAVAKWTLDKDKAQKAIDDENAAVEAKFKKDADTYTEKLTEFKKTTDDFDDAIDDVSHIQMCGALQQAIILSDIAPNVMYELAKNPAELERINKLTPMQIAKEVVKVEMKLAKSVTTDSVETENKITKAPAPIIPLSGKGQAVKKTIFNASSQKEYEALREQQRQKA